jgi:hypothetical protein
MSKERATQSHGEHGGHLQQVSPRTTNILRPLRIIR